MSESCNCLQHADATRCIVGHFRLEFLQLAKPIGAPLLLRRDSRCATRAKSIQWLRNLRDLNRNLLPHVDCLKMNFGRLKMWTIDLVIATEILAGELDKSTKPRMQKYQH